MKYIICEEHKDGNTFTEEFDGEKEAIKRADSLFSAIWDEDKKKFKAYYVLKSANPDEDAPDHYDGDIVKSYM